MQNRLLDPQSKPLRKLTIILEPDLARTLLTERARIAQAEGVNVSLTALASRAMRAGFGHGRN